MTTMRQKAFEAINLERDYQDWRWPKHKHSVTEYLVYIDNYVKRGMQKVSTQGDGEHEALEDLRKIAALAVAAMEENGVKYRTVLPMGLPNAGN